MYLPTYARVDDRDRQLALMRAHPFATLVTAPEGVPFATHLPLLVEEEAGELYLRSHLARANPQWRHFDEREVLAVFQGPHALVNSAWYATSPNVPTWNYAAVHAYGPARAVEGEAARAVARRLLEAHTPGAPPIPADFETRLLAGVVTFELRVSRLEGKFKLSQNKPGQDRQNVIEQLSNSPHQHERDTAELMRRLG